MYLVKVAVYVHLFAVSAYYPCGNAYRRAVGRNFLQHHRVCGNFSVVAHLERTKHSRSGAHHNVVAESRVTLALFLARTAKRNSLINKAVVAYFGSLADNHPRTVVYKKTLAYLRARVYLDTRQKPRKLRNAPCDSVQLFRVKPVGYPVHKHRVQPRIGQQYFHRASCRGVSPFYRFDVGLYMLKQLCLPLSVYINAFYYQFSVFATSRSATNSSKYLTCSSQSSSIVSKEITYAS